MAESLFGDQLLEKKWRLVKEHFESAYRVKFKSDLPKEKIEYLYQELQKLARSCENYQKK